MTNDAKNASLLSGKTIKNAVFIGGVGGLVLAQFRLLTLFIIALVGLLFISFPRSRQRIFIIPAAIIVIVSMFLPFDVALGSWHYGTRVGSGTGGPHFVKFSYGLTSDEHLIKAYGECIDNGCTPPSMFPPKWILELASLVIFLCSPHWLPQRDTRTALTFHSKAWLSCQSFSPL